MSDDHGSGPDPLDEGERAALMRAERPKRGLPIAPHAPEAKRRLPLLAAREKDARYKPIYAVWEITLACDLACRHCGSRAGRDRPDELTTEECLDLVDQMAALGVKEVSLIGGEAYLRDDWTQILKRIRSHGMMALLTTGGRGLTPERCADAAAAGLQSTSVSIDGDRETHDRLRGVVGSYDAAMQAFDNLRAAGIKVSANTQINRLSMPLMPEILERIIEAGVHSWQIQLTVAMGRAADEPEVLLQPYDLLELFPMLGALKKRCDEARVRMWPGNNIGYFGPYESTLRGTMPRGHMASCGAGRATLGIEADGAIKGCPSLPTDRWVGGNIRDRPLKEIWEQTEPLRYTRDRTVEDLWGYCRDCYYNDVCRAGCTWTSFVLFGKAGNNPYCHHRALERQREGKRERVVKVSEAPGLPFDYGHFELVLEDDPDALLGVAAGE
ncbi:MAG: radical SAM protein [Sandaracinaceae bacterium]|nr:radical SAM protein [Sandaracinaceae bacterium]